MCLLIQFSYIVILFQFNHYFNWYKKLHKQQPTNNITTSCFIMAQDLFFFINILWKIANAFWYLCWLIISFIIQKESHYTRYKKIQLLTVLYIWNSNQRIIIDISFNSASYTIYFLYLWMMWPRIGRMLNW